MAIWEEVALVGVGGVVGGVSSLLTAWLTARGERSRLRETAAIDAASASRRLRRQQQEEVYVLFEKWATMYVGKLNLRMYVMRGELTFNQMLDQEIERGSGPQPDYARMVMLIQTQLRSLRHAWENVQRDRDRCNRIMEQHRARYREDGLPDLGAEAALRNELEAFTKSAETLQAEVVKLFATPDAAVELP